MRDPIDLVEKSFQEVQTIGDRFAVAVIQNLNEKCPDVTSVFNFQAGKHQHDAMMQMFSTIISNLRTPHRLRKSLDEFTLGQKETVLDDPDPVLQCGDALIETMAIFLADQWTPNLHAAWEMAFNQVYELLETSNQI